jgi:hypothetical protein
VIDKFKNKMDSAASTARSNIEDEFNKSGVSASNINESLSSNKIKVHTVKTLQFEAPMTAYFWVVGYLHKNIKGDGETWFWKADGRNALDEVSGKNDYVQLRTFLTKYLESEESLFGDFTIVCEWTKIQAKTLINGVWFPGHPPPEWLCYVGIVFDKIELTQGDINEKLYFVKTWPSHIFYHSISQLDLSPLANKQIQIQLQQKNE